MEKDGKYFLSSEESVDEGVSSRLMETSVQNDETKGGALTNAFIRGDIDRKKNNFILSYCAAPPCFREKSSLSTIVYRVVGNDSVKNSSAITGRKDTTRKCARKEIMAHKPQDVADSYVACFLPAFLSSLLADRSIIFKRSL